MGHLDEDCKTVILKCDKCGKDDHETDNCKTCEICLDGNHLPENCLNKPCSICGHSKHRASKCKFIEN